jgi:tetratricopeptide (TPR) repeat protein
VWLVEAGALCKYLLTGAKVAASPARRAHNTDMIFRRLANWRRRNPENVAVVPEHVREDPAIARLFDEARHCLATGEFVRAEASLNSVLAIQHDCAEAHMLLGEVKSRAGAIEDALDCYRMAVHFAPDLVAAHVALATTLLALQLPDEAESACRAALALDRSSVPALFCLGNIHKSRHDLEQAAAVYQSAVAFQPDAVDVLHQLAFVEFRRGRYDIAKKWFDALLAIAPASARAHHNFGLLQLETGYAGEALSSFRRALQLQPGTVETITCIGHALRDLDRLDEAMEAYDSALALRPSFGDAVSNRAQVMLMRSDFRAGWPAYEQRFDAGGRRGRSAGLSRWQGEPLAGRTIVVFSEQGLGDEIMFASCLPELVEVAGRVIIACDKRLQTLFARSFAAATIMDRDECNGSNPEIQEADFEISIGSLPLYLRKAPANFPAIRGYLIADAVKVASWRARFAGHGVARTIGIAWRGGTLRNRGHLRSIDLEACTPFLVQSGCRFVSLQHGEVQNELDALREHRQIDIRNVADATGASIDELAAAIIALDLVITVDNSVAHLAGALGRPVWILLPFSAEWRYGRGAGEVSMVWYPSARLFRQSTARDWTAAIQNVAQSIAQDD